MTVADDARLPALKKQHPTRLIWPSSDGRWYATSTVRFSEEEILAGHTVTVTAGTLDDLAELLSAQPALIRTAA